MKRLIILIFLITGFMASFATPPYFNSMSEKEDFNYTFVAPSMLKMMGDKIVDYNLNIRASDISSIETVSTAENGTDSDLWKLIRQIKKKMNLETLTTKKEPNYRYDVLGKLTGDRKHILKMLVITQNTGDNVSVVYIEGKIPVSDLLLQF